MEVDYRAFFNVVGWSTERPLPWALVPKSARLGQLSLFTFVAIRRRVYIHVYSIGLEPSILEILHHLMHTMLPSRVLGV